MPLFFIHYLRLIALGFFVLFPIHKTPARQSFCPTTDITIAPLLLQKFKAKFNKEMTAHYDKLLKEKKISKSEKIQRLKKYNKNLEVKVCQNPQNAAQNLVYIEYEKNWWGKLYFAVVKNHKILKWMRIGTYGATTNSVRWNKKSFFYEDSTHMGTKTQNTCSIQKNSVQCKKTKQYR